MVVYDILDAAWLYMAHVVWKGRFKYESWKNDIRMNDRKFFQTFEKLNMEVDENGIVITNDIHEKIIDEYFLCENIEKVIDRKREIKNYKFKDGFRYYYPIHNIPYSYFLKVNPKIDKAFDKIHDTITLHYNSQKCNSHALHKLVNMDFIHEFNKFNFLRNNKDLTDNIKIYRGIKNKSKYPEEGKYSCWSTDKKQAERFAKYYFTGGIQLSPSYTDKPTLLEKEISFKDIIVYIGGKESEIILNNDNSNIKVHDLWKINCDKCDRSWEIEKDDKDPYLCHNCGYNNDFEKFEIDKLNKWKEDNL